MLLTVLLAAMTMAPTSSPLRPMHQGKSNDCPRERSYYADDVPGPARARRLDELPPGRLELTVYRSVNGCPIPAVVREGMGGNPTSGEGQGTRD